MESNYLFAFAVVKLRLNPIANYLRVFGLCMCVCVCNRSYPFVHFTVLNIQAHIWYLSDNVITV